jgi:hypothetical protein
MNTDGKAQGRRIDEARHGNFSRGKWLDRLPNNTNRRKKKKNEEADA